MLHTSGQTTLTILVVLLGLCTRGLGSEVFTLDTEDYGTFNSAVAALGADVGTLGISGAAKVDADITVGRNITLAFVRGGYLDLGAGVTVQINGPVDAVPRRIFAGGGYVYFGDGRVPELYPQWWGAVGDGKADDTAAIQQMVVAAAGAEMLCRFPHGHYRITEPMTVEATDGMQWRMPPGARIDAFHDNPDQPYALVLLNCNLLDLEVRLHVEHKGQRGILLHSEAGRNSCCNKIKGQIQGPGRSVGC